MVVFTDPQTRLCPGPQNTTEVSKEHMGVSATLMRDYEMAPPPQEPPVTIFPEGFPGGEKDAGLYRVPHQSLPSRDNSVITACN